MDKIFDYNEMEKTAYINWRTRVHEPLHNMSVIAAGYFKGAIMMAEDCIRDNHDKKADIVIFPILFSVNHAIEVYLKAINWSLNILLEKEGKFTGGHDIRQIWNTVKGLVKEYESDKDMENQFLDMTKELDAYIVELYEKIAKNNTGNSKMKNMDFSRYPFNTSYENHYYIETFENEVVGLETFVNTFKIISDNLNSISGYYEERATFVPDYE